MVYKKIKSTTPAPNPTAVCPDYWYSSYYDVTGDPMKDAEQMNLSSYGDELDRTLKCYNVKKMGSTTCSSSMDFSGDEWNGSDGLCNKQKLNIDTTGICQLRKDCNLVTMFFNLCWEP